eukprot:159512-Amphidinium_carterae.4
MLWQGGLRPDVNFKKLVQSSRVARITCITCRQMRDEILAKLKSFIVTKGARDLLKEGLLCMQLIPLELETNSNKELNKMLAEMLDATSSSEDLPVNTSSWFHISLNYFKSFRPTLPHLIVVASRAETVCVEMTLRWMTLWEMVKLMDTKVQWTCQFHILQSTQAPVAQLKPTQVLIKAAGDVYTLWPPAKRGRKRGGKNTYTCTRKKRGSAKESIHAELVGELPGPLEHLTRAEPSHASLGVEMASSDSDVSLIWGCKRRREGRTGRIAGIKPCCSC